MRIASIVSPHLNLTNWEIIPGETWCVLGNNASGKSQLAASLAKPDNDSIANAPSKVSLVSFETAQAEYDAEIEKDDSDFLDRIDYGTTGMGLLKQSGKSTEEILPFATKYGLDKLLDRGYRQFSTGELRRLSLAREVLSDPDLLILDEPYEGLDVQSVQKISELIETLIQSGHQVILFANRRSDISPWCTHLALLEHGSLIAKGSIQEVQSNPELDRLFPTEMGAAPKLPEAPEAHSISPIFKLSEVQIKYGSTYQFKDLNWTLMPGDHSLIVGPNGCGKSSLLALLTGDHPQCYTNQIDIFGFRRGTGESIWEIKKNIGYLSPALHRDYRVSCDLTSVLISGFFDSIGLYQTPNAQQRRIALQWLELFDLQEHQRSSFRSLSYGQQRLALIARALIKQPPLVILDEPTQGLDDFNRQLVLSCLDRLAGLKQTTLLFVSHRVDEHLSLFKKRLQFEPISPQTDTLYQIVKNF
ncbi:ATP-binding cassette domain-containing protein [Pelagicoccus albus]|uniref:ATP-binding cassette domain-containing protein n=1 Tax=Pelagicoccus albus TaxID=415222 RepID=A0A7X1B3Z6_9BACT|nr:ATP-binding cassette domain-containing protein [Pelagicoccus albus]